MTAYEEATAYLAGLEVARGWDLGLDRMRALLARRGNPEQRFATIHIAGTNGKGSTAAIVERVLRAAGRRTGLFTSPHLVDFAERIRAGGATIPHDDVVRLVDDIRTDAAAADISLTHFEFVTAIALSWFAEIGVEVAVIEVGLGGRLDATNVVRPVVTAITSIALDHEQFLGSTLASIAREKAGIAKRGVPLVLGDGLADEAMSAIAAAAAAVGAPLVSAGQWLPGREGDRFVAPSGSIADGLVCGLSGAFQYRNAATALTVLDSLPPSLACGPAAVRAGLLAAEWPGRLAVVQRAPLVLVDGAHNPAGAATLAAELSAVLGEQRVTLVFAVMADKAWTEILSRLLPFARQAIVTRVGRRGLDPAALAAACPPQVPATIEPDPQRAVERAVAEAGADGAVLVAGSLFLVGEAYEALQGPNARLFPEWHSWERFGTGALA